MTQLFHLRALDRFACTGPECPASCCSAAWKIDVDPPTLALWHRLEAGELRAALLRHLRYEGENAYLEYGGKNDCPHLSAQRLCTIQATLGPDYMPATCRSYPRLGGERGPVALQSAALSCPEVVRLVLFGGEEAPCFSRHRRPGGGGTGFVEAGLGELADAVWGASQTAPGLRLHLLGELLVEVVTLAGTGQLKPVYFKKAGRAVAERLAGSRKRAGSDGTLCPPDPAGGLFWHAMYQLGREHRIFSHPAATADEGELIRLLARPEAGEEGYREIHTRLRQARQLAQAQLGDRLEPLLDRYLAVSLLNKGFPYVPFSGNYVATFLNAVLPLAVIDVELWLIAAAAAPLGEREIIAAIVNAERALSHGEFLYRFLNDHPRLLRIDHYLPLIAEMA